MQFITLAVLATSAFTPVVMAAPMATAGSLGLWAFLIKWWWSHGAVLPSWPPAGWKNCPDNWPYPQNWNWDLPHLCPGKVDKPPTPKFPPGCKPDAPKNWTMACPVKPAGQIKDGQIQCNSPYPAVDFDSDKNAAIKSVFSVQNGQLFDQYSRACEISYPQQQLQCNYIADLTQAQKGFSIDSATNYLMYNGENTWYGCNIGTDSSFGQIIFTGTHRDFSGVQTTTENPNCAAYHLTAQYV
ncbi:hypothetical protein PYCC9005_004270 [Savitreella phatthalungensis]